ncbi:MAG TPA: glycosyltransferase [Bacteroidales bacterium]|nr:glycosyltransferase [Bacteroidales bacterium]
MNIFFSYFESLSIVELVLGASLLLFFIIQVLYSLILFRKPQAFEKKREERNIDEAELPGISVIITSKNNSFELEKNLPYFLNQNYPVYEVIVVNSGSTDDTDVVLKAAEQNYSQLYHTFIPAGSDEVNEKKLAITLGVKAAKYDIVLFSESYCRPTSNNWIREFGKEFTKGKDILLGYSRVVFTNRVRLGNFIRYDNLIHHLKFLSMSIAGKPFMGIGRNMAYKKELFFENKGLSSVLGIDGGEDDLYINRISSRKNTEVLLSRDSITETDSVDGFLTWRSIKSKYLYTKQFYKGPANFILGFETITKHLFYLILLFSIVASIYFSNYILLGFSVFLFLIRFVTLLLIINKNSMLFDSRKFNINLLFFDILQPISNLRFKKYANRRNKYRR